MDLNTEKIIKENNEKTQELETKVIELERRLRYYEIREIYQGLLPEELLQKLLELPPEMVVIGKYFKERSAESMKSEKASKHMGDGRMLPEPKSVEMKLNGIKAKIGSDLNFAQKYDFNGSVAEGDYVIQKESGATLGVLPYSKPGFVVVPTWVRERIKVNDFVEVVKR
ncbi:MAG: hypothetical protein QXU17_05915 [Archaeoglobaceae archaeon]